MIRARDVPRELFPVLAAATLARVAALLFLPPRLWVDGGDMPLYVQQGWLLAHGKAPLFTRIAPVYSWVLAAVWSVFPDAPYPESAGAIPVAYLTLVRAIQIVLSVGTVAAAIALARQWADGRRACLVTGLALALAPAFVVDPFQILTETLFLGLLVVGLLLSATLREGSPAAQIPVGIVFGLAALTRPVIAVFPIVLGLWLFASGAGTGGRRRWLALLRGLVLVLSFFVTVAPWSWSLRRQGGSFVPQGFLPNMWLGSVDTGAWPGSRAADDRRSRFANGPEDYLGEVATRIRTAPVEWLILRMRNLGWAVLQPHFPSGLPGPGPTLRESFAQWERRGHRFGEFLVFLAQPAALLKVALYLVHGVVLVLGIGGLVRWRRRWRDIFPVFAAALYFPVVHVFLTALPRYLLPAEVALWVAASLAFTPPDRGLSAAASR